MGLFRKKVPSVQQDTRAVVAPTAEDLGVVIHVMPKDFLGASAALRIEPVPTPVAPPIVVTPPHSAVSHTPVPLPKRRSVPLWMWVAIAVLLLFVIAAVAYVMLGKSQTQPIEPPVPEAQSPESPEKPIVKPPVTPVVTAPVLSKDSDSDGLTDIEEKMYGTDFRNPDTDGDTFLDGNEVFHRYDPLGVAPSTLLDTGAVQVFADLALPFTLYYPATWKASAEPVKHTVTFTSSSVAAIVVTWSMKASDLTVEDWIVTNVKDADLKTLQASYTKEGYYTLRSADDLIAYVDLGATVYVLTYDLGTSKDISYTQTFAMMVNSLTVTP